MNTVDTNPIGVAIHGHRGSGKTHLVGWTRERTHEALGYFFLVGPLSGSTFWKAVSSAFRRGLLRQTSQGEPQLVLFLARLSDKVDAPKAVADAILGRATLTSELLDDFVGYVRSYDRELASTCQDTLRALILHNSPVGKVENIGKGYLLCGAELEAGERGKWGIRNTVPAPPEVVSETTHLLAVTGPSVVAFDQIDSVTAELGTDDVDDMNATRDSLLDQVADGLVTIYSTSSRTLTLLSCLSQTWTALETQSIAPVVDRFRLPIEIGGIDSAELAADLLARRFDEPLARAGFPRPYPTWPVRREAFKDFAPLTPRRLLQRVDEHVNRCLATGEFAEIVGLNSDDSLRTVPIGKSGGKVTDLDQELKALDDRFEALRSDAAVKDALDGDLENLAMPPLLNAALEAWIREQGADSDQFDLDPPPGPKPDLHARLVRSLNEETGEELSWSLRAISSLVPQAALYRLKAACEEADVEDPSGRRRLFILRTPDWNDSPRTREAVERFEAAGGRRLTIIEDDLKRFAALASLLTEAPAFLQEWLVARSPAGSTTTLKAVFGVKEQQAVKGPQPLGGTGTPPKAGRASMIRVGAEVDTGTSAMISLESLRRHTVIFAGSGSGKTVLIRRLVEECALRGVSSIVLDPNNDLARLGEAWPESPAGWQPGDAKLAAEYIAKTDVVIWTPRRAGGRPLSFQPLPDFGAVRDNADEMDAAIDSATATLASRVSLGAANRARVAEAVLRESLRRFAAQQGGGSLKDFLDLLADLPGDVTDLDPNGRVALGLAQALRAAVINDPLFGGRGDPVDPGLLLTPRHGKRARVSVISLVGLTTNEQKQSFVNQLEMGLFAWIKRHPADDRPLSGLLVMDEAQNFAPSAGATPSTASTLALVAQARKYGFGMVFATQQPKGLHNHIPGNAATQFYGRLNAPVQIATVQEMARAKGGNAQDVGRLSVGEFYLAADEQAFTKLSTPLCLSYHGRPLTEDEVVRNARDDEIEDDGEEGRDQRR